MPRGHFANGGGSTKYWSDNRYTNQLECRTCNLTRTFLRNGQVAYKKGQDEIFYEMITNVINNNVVADDFYTCPNCGRLVR